MCIEISDAARPWLCDGYKFGYVIIRQVTICRRDISPLLPLGKPLNVDPLDERGRQVTQEIVQDLGLNSIEKILA